MAGIENATPRPWAFNRMPVMVELAQLQGKELEEHEGYFRGNDGSWSITAEDAHICKVSFHGNAKRGQMHLAPDPEGMANAQLIVTAVNTYEQLIADRDALLEALKLALEAMQNALERDDPEACTQMEWDQEPLDTMRRIIAQVEAHK